MKGREPPKALDAFVYAERGVYRSGETVHLAALLRDAEGVATSAPLTLVVKRPDGVEHQRVALPDQGLGGRALDLVLPSGAAAGGWTVQAFSDPKSPAIGETGFLVEDYVPERMDMALTPKSAAVRAGQTAQIGVAVRYLYGAPGAGLIINGDVEIEAATDHGLPALNGYEAGVADEDFSAVQNELEDTPTTDAKGAAVVNVAIPMVKATRPLQAKIVLRAGEEGGRAIERVTYCAAAAARRPDRREEELFQSLARARRRASTSSPWARTACGRRGATRIGRSTGSPMITNGTSRTAAGISSR